ncbi:MAG: rRNA adenine N-6-methyltransferase family protein [Chitinophagales bacterium]
MKDKQVASVVPSSKYSVRYLKGKINFKDADVILEYGPGNGVFSEMLLSNMTPSAKLVLFETNPEFVKVLKLKFDSDDRVIVVKESALNVNKVLKRLKIKEADYIITGIPFTFLSPRQRLKLVQSSHSALKKGGKFISYQFSITVNKYIKRQFGTIKLGIQPLNIPPLLVVEGEK